MGTPNPIEDSALWSFCWLGGEQLPAVCEVTGASGVDLDVKKAKGSDGATITDNGYTPAKLSLKATFVPQFFAKMQEICDRLNPRKPGGPRKPVEIRHARTDFLGIHSVYIQEISTPDTDDRGMMSLSISLLEWVPEPKKTKTGTSVKVFKADPPPFERPKSFVTQQFSPTPADSGAYHTGPNGSMTPADEDFLNFMQNTM
jgi:hypothetical protein